MSSAGQAAWRPPLSVPQQQQPPPSALATTGPSLNYFMLKLPEAIPLLMIAKLHPNAILPTKATNAAVGFDLFAFDDYEIPPESIQVIKTGIRATPPNGHYLLVTGRSGLSQRGFLVIQGTIDPDYTGDISVIVHNVNRCTLYVQRGNRIAQMIPIKFASSCVSVVMNVTELARNDALAIAAGARGTRGFGSSGI